MLKPDVIVGLESRSFILLGAIAYKLELPFVLLRKKNKLPGQVKNISYSLHYGEVFKFLNQFKQLLSLVNLHLLIGYY